MDYEQISIKVLTQRARINRKTFYLHYNTLDNLLRELQNEMEQNFIKRTQDMERPRDMDKITREFLLCSEELGKLGEQITCRKSQQNSSPENPYIQNIIITYVTQSTLEIYKQWVADGKRVPLEDIIKITAKLICNGIIGLDL